MNSNSINNIEISDIEKALENEPVDKIRRRIQRLLGISDKGEKEQRYIDISDISVEPTPWDTCLLETNIAGTFYRDMMVMEGRIEQGDILYLAREPDNKYDTNAILVTAEDGYVLGYIPRVDNDVLANMMDDGKELYAVLYSDSLDDGKPDISVMLRRELEQEDKVIDLGKYQRFKME